MSTTSPIFTTFNAQSGLRHSVHPRRVWSATEGRYRDPQEGASASLQYLVYPVGERDELGVLITVDDDEGYAEVTLDVPVALPLYVQTKLQAMSGIRIPFTEKDASNDAAAGGPVCEWEYANDFTHAVADARALMREALTSAVWAFARNQHWTPPHG